VILLAFAFSFSVSLSPLKQQAISYSTVATPISRVLEDFGKQFHLKLFARGDMGRQPIIISVKDVPVKDLLEKVAKVAYGTWVEGDGGYELRRDEAAIQAAEKARHKELVDGYAKAIADASAEDQKAGPYSIEKAHDFFDAMKKSRDRGQSLSEAEQKRIGEVMAVPRPAEIALHEILAAIGPEALAAIPKGTTVVFSTRPNRRQLQFEAGSEQIVANYLAGEKNWNQAWGETPHPQHFGGRVSLDENKGPDKVDRMEVSISNESDYVTATLAVVGVETSQADQSRYQLRTALNETDNGIHFGKGVPKDQQIPTSPEARWLISFKNVGVEESSEESSTESYTLDIARPKPEPPGMAAKLLRPDEFEPLSWSASELLIGLAHLDNVGLVAVLPDNWWKETLTSAASDEVRSSIEADSNVRGSFKDGWLEIRTADPEQSLSERTDRTELAALLGSLHDPKNWRLDILGGYYAKHYRDLSPLADDYIAIPDQVAQGYTEKWPKDQLAFYGSLSPFDRQALFSGGAIRLGDLPAEAQSILDGMIRNGTVPLSEDDPNALTIPPMGFGSSDLLPDGIDPNGALRVESTACTAARFTVRSQESSPGLASFDEVTFEDASRIAEQISSGGSSSSGDPQGHADLSKIHLVKERDLVFNIQFSRKLSTNFSLSEHTSLNNEEYKLDTLPADFKKAIADEVAKIKKESAEVKKHQDKAGGEGNP